MVVGVSTVHMAPPAVGLCHKLGEIKSDGPTMRGLFGIHNKFSSNDTGTSLPPDRVHNIQQECQNIVEKPICSVRALSRLIGKLTASVMAVLPVLGAEIPRRPVFLASMFTL